jgi:hypothetical protein
MISAFIFNQSMDKKKFFDIRAKFVESESKEDLLFQDSKLPSPRISDPKSQNSSQSKISSVEELRKRFENTNSVLPETSRSKSFSIQSSSIQEMRKRFENTIPTTATAPLSEPLVAQNPRIQETPKRLEISSPSEVIPPRSEPPVVQNSGIQEIRKRFENINQITYVAPPPEFSKSSSSSIQEIRKRLENAIPIRPPSPRSESSVIHGNMTREIQKRFDNPILFQTDLSQIEAEEPVSISNDQIQNCVSSIIERNIMTAELLNPEIDVQTKEKIKERLSKKAKSGYVFQNKIDKKMTIEQQKKQIKNIENMMIPNPYVIEDVEMMEPITIEQIEKTKIILENKNFQLSCQDSNAIYHIMSQIAQDQGLDFVIMDSKETKRSKDSIEKATDFALENQVITEDSLFMLGSESIEHQVKAFSIHLEGSPRNLPTQPDQLQHDIHEIKQKLAKVHGVNIEDITILSVTEGSLKINYTVNHLTKKSVEDLENKYKQEFDKYQSSNIHASFLFMQIDSNSFSTQWNRDFTIQSNCPKNEKRGGQNYHPPFGYYRYGLNVSGKYDNGDNTWLGMSNVPGEWCIAYHGTSQQFVKSIVNSLLRFGTGIAFGKGIYCSPDINTSYGYCRSKLDLDTIDGKKTFSYIFMCRINVRNIHRCSKSPCPDAENQAYTVHFTTSSNIWFVNNYFAGF